ncbi:DNA-binding response regulator [Streptomyces sp. SDr-06]|uniref:response regulator n=1 Tax=Streptomyces sp. SDr-06 TaxID=2267702 RepID=UPI000DEA90BC|nr:response regulator transcription factor [Streptomyces sp. SDr-06]RCH64212.1 DNA-binding response regulator [Streptomyces sp. SDr-06]
MSTRVVVVDDQAVIREGLMTLLDMMPGIDVVAGGANGEEALAHVAETHPDAVLMDLSMPGMGGVEATRRIVAAHPDVAVVVLTTMADDQLILDALQAGARAYLTKDAGKTEIVRAIEAAVARHTTLDPIVQERLLAAALRGAGQPTERRPEPSQDLLTPRESDVLRLLAQGLSNRAIGRRLLVGEATVKTHVNHLFAKLRIRNRAEAVAWAHTHGFGPDGDAVRPCP